MKLIQICDGKKTEYYAHRAVLCNQSTYFQKAFKGHFRASTCSKQCQNYSNEMQEAKEPNMKLYDDNPAHFKFALKFMYTLDYDVSTVANNKHERDAHAYILCLFRLLRGLAMSAAVGRVRLCSW